jgi:hypothetical protein
MSVAQGGRFTMRSGSTVSFVSLLVAIAGLGVAVAASPAFADWPSFGLPVCSAANNQEHPAITTDGADGAILVWQDRRNAPMNLFAQHVLASGDVDAAWPANGRQLLTDPAALTQEVIGIASPVIATDGAGGAIVAWEDNRSDATGTDIFAQHVLASGVVDSAWPANGTGLAVVAGLQNLPVIVPDGAGGAIVAWMDTRAGSAVADIYAQHVLASGLVDSRWPANGLAVGAAAGLQEFPAIVADGAGGAIIAWDDGRSAVTGFDIYAQHVLNAGTADPAWPLGGCAVCAATGDQGHPTLTADGVHGALVAWSDARVVGTSHIFAHHVLASGAVDPAWPANGQAVSAAGLLESRPLVVPDGVGGAIMTWQAFTVHLNLFAQHVLAAGTVDPAWPAGGRALFVTDRQQSHADMVSDGAGGAVIAWQDSEDVVAQHVLASGALDPLYPDTTRALCNLPSQQGDVGLVASSGGGAIASWTDSRNATGNGADIFALQVLNAGTVGVAPGVPRPIAFARPSPNPARGPFTLRFTLPREAQVRLDIYDALGRRVRRVVSGAEPAGEHSLAWDRRDDAGATVRPGLYFAHLESEGRTITHKLVVVRS